MSNRGAFAPIAVALEGAGFAIPISIGSVGLLYAHINPAWILQGVTAALLGMLLMHFAGAQSSRPMVYAVRFMEVATLVNFLEIFITKMPAWGLTDSPELRLMLVMLVCFGVALVLPIFYQLQFDRFARLIPLPVFAGFGNAICLTILLSQSKVIYRLINDHNWVVVALILLTALTAFVSQRLKAGVPAGVVGLFMAALFALGWASLGHSNIAMIGGENYTLNLPVLLVPWRDIWMQPFAVWSVISNIAFASFVVAVVVFLNSVIAEAYMTQMDGKRADKRDWMPLGGAQLVSIAAGCMPLSPSISASRAALNTGILTPLTMVSLAVVCLLVYLTGILAFVPVAAISGVLLFDAWSNAHRPSLKLTYQYLVCKSSIRAVQKEDLILVWMVVAAAVFYNMIFGVLVGVLGGLVMYAIRNGRRMVRSIRTGENMHSNCVWSAHESELLRLHGKETHIVTLDGALFFGVADTLQSTLKDELLQCKRLILDWSLVTSLDSAVVMAIGNVLNQAKIMQVKVVFCALEAADPEVKTTLEVGMTLPPSFADVDRALEWAEVDILQSLTAYSYTQKSMSLDVLAQMLGLKDRESLDFIGILEMRRYCLGQTVFERGALGGEMLFILKGGADVRIPGFDGRDVRVALYNQGSMVGEMGFLDGQPRSATVTAVSDLSVAVLDRSAFDRFATEHSSAARQILMHVAMELNARLRRTNRIL